MTTADKIRNMPIPDDLTSEEASGYWLCRDQAAALVEAEPQAVRVKPDWDYFQGLVNIARRSAEKAKIKFPQPNYVTLKIAEEAGEVVRGAVHYAEGRMEWDEVQGEIVQLLAMLIRFVTEGDEVNGIKPPDLVTRTPPAVDASHAPETVSKAPSSPLPCKVCHSAEHLRWHRIGSWLPGMPAVPYVIRCHNIEHDLVEGPEGYGQNGAIDAWNAAVAPAPDPVSKTPTLDAMAMQRAALAFVDQASIASCTCGIKSPNHEWHFEQCRYRTLQEVADRIDAITMPDHDAALAEAMQLPEIRERLEDDVAHPDDVAVNRFAKAMKAKLAQARAKGRSGWDDPAQCSETYLARLLVTHLGKGNHGTFEDVANFAMMLHQRDADPRVLKQAIETQSYSEMLAEAMRLPEVKALVDAVERLRPAVQLLPIKTHDTPDYAEATGPNFQAMTMAPAAFDALNALSDVFAALSTLKGASHE